MSNSRQNKSKMKPEKKEFTEQDVINEAKSLQNLVKLSALIFLSLLILVLLFWGIS